MGVLLLSTVPALRAFDFALARGWEGRKRALLTTVAFALAGGLTIYALQPYLWGDPVGRAVEWWTTLSDHPYKAGELFRGAVHSGADFPAEYLPVWFSITSPPFALALGFAGAAFVLIATGRSIRRALRNGRSRFALLLAGCFAAPIPIVILLDANGLPRMAALVLPMGAVLAAGGVQAEGAGERVAAGAARNGRSLRRCGSGLGGYSRFDGAHSSVSTGIVQLLRGQDDAGASPRAVQTG